MAGSGVWTESDRRRMEAARRRVEKKCAPHTAAMRAWCADVWEGYDESEARDDEVRRQVARHYVGGIDGFIRDSA